MTKTNFKNFIRTLRGNKDLDLTHDEKLSLRTSLLRDLNIKDIKDITGMPGASRIKSPLSQWEIFFMSTRVRVTVIAVLIFVLSGGGVVWAAEQSLPGDILYPIKTQVNENVVRAIKSVSPAAKAEFEVQLVDRRLKEAEALEKLNLKRLEKLEKDKSKEPKKSDSVNNGANVVDVKIDVNADIGDDKDDDKEADKNEKKNVRIQAEIQAEVITQSIRAKEALKKTERSQDENQSREEDDEKDKINADINIGVDKNPLDKVLEQHKDIIKKWSDEEDSRKADIDIDDKNNRKDKKQEHKI